MQKFNGTTLIRSCMTLIKVLIKSCTNYGELTHFETVYRQGKLSILVKNVEVNPSLINSLNWSISSEIQFSSVGTLIFSWHLVQIGTPRIHHQTMTFAIHITIYPIETPNSTRYITHPWSASQYDTSWRITHQYRTVQFYTSSYTIWLPNMPILRNTHLACPQNGMICL